LNSTTKVVIEAEFALQRDSHILGWHFGDINVTVTLMSPKCLPTFCWSTRMSTFF